MLKYNFATLNPSGHFLNTKRLIFNEFLVFLILLFLFDLLILSCSNNDGKSNNIPDIIPGKRLYELEIGGYFKDARALYGKPDMVIDHTTYFFVSYRNGYRDFVLWLVILDKNSDWLLDDYDEIALIDCSDINWEGTTDNGNGFNSTLNSIIEEFGECESAEHFYCCYPSLGIGWYFYNDSIHCDGIMIQPPHNHKYQNEYKIEPDNKR